VKKQLREHAHLGAVVSGRVVHGAVDESDATIGILHEEVL
jgi:hypothetical protein